MGEFVAALRLVPASATALPEALGGRRLDAVQQCRIDAQRAQHAHEQTLGFRLLLINRAIDSFANFPKP